MISKWLNGSFIRLFLLSVSTILFYQVMLYGPPVNVSLARAAESTLTLDRIYEDPPLDGQHLKSLKWTEDGKMLGFLRPSAVNRYILELWVYEVAAGQPRLLVRATDIVSPKGLELSDDEIQILERKRISQRGITTYEWSPGGQSILFPLGGGLYVYDLEAGKVVLLDDGSSGPLLDPRFSPDGKLVSFVRGRDLWIIPSVGGEARQLTSGATPTLSRGLAEFVAQEEMGRHRGYWWSENCDLIAYLEVDESHVEVWKRTSYRSSGASVSDQRYPAAGKPNASVRAGILDIESGTTRWIDLGDDVEYIARVDWDPGDRFLAIQVQPRNQRWLRLVFADPRTGTIRKILEDRADSYVNLHDDLIFLDDGRFLWSSETSGMRQIYLYDEEGTLITQLTRHDLPVVQIDGLNEAEGRVFYTAVTNSSLEKHLFSISLQGGEPERITSKPGWHSVKLPEDGGHYTDTHSSLLSPGRVTLHDSNGRELAVLEDNPTPELDEYEFATPEFIEVTAADGVTPLNAVMTRPLNFDPSEQYPVLIYSFSPSTAT
jgi:dipeptidyl-peptidase-4